MIRKITLLLFCLAFAHMGRTQDVSNVYSALVRKADSLYDKKDFKSSAFYFSAAFKSNKWTGRTNDRYNAACSWALSGNSDSAFFQLEKIATSGNYTNFGHVANDSDLISLHDDKRWVPLLMIVKQNEEKAKLNFNKPLVAQLDSIYTEDQKYREMASEVEAKFGFESNEMRSLWKTMNTKDSINLIKVTRILDTSGWLGSDVVGHQGNVTLFLVIQHSDQKTQEKYLPMMRDAVKNGKAQGSNLALLEDRVALAQGKKQIYGSQIHRDLNGHYFVAPIDDEVNVNKRRAAVGLNPLEDYVQHWDINYILPTK